LDIPANKARLRPALRRAAPALLILLALIAGGGQAGAQTIERHQAPGLQAPATAPIAPAEPPANLDDRPLGISLVAIVLLKVDDPIPSDAHGVDSQRIRIPDQAKLDRRLAVYIGKPLSRSLLAQVTATIVEHYRRAGQPFVTVDAPPQEITRGVLALHVVAFRLGRRTASGGSVRADRAVENAIRLKSGDHIEAARLQQDLDWLNHSPFHSVTAVFAPGASPGDTDLSLQIQNAKPWQVYAGYANDGAPSSGLDRWSLGGMVGDLILPGSLVSYALTTSDDFWDQGGRVLGGMANPQYVSNSLVVAVPLAPRQDFNLVADAIDSTTVSKAFQTRSHTEEVSGVYRTALSNVAPLPGDASLGLEARHQQSATYFGDVKVVQHDVAIGQIVIGWADSWVGAAGQQSLSITGHISPGGLTAGNRDSDFAAFTNGRMTRSEYAYADLDYSGDFKLPEAWRYVTGLKIQLADQPLADTEQLAIGGESNVRAYVYDDASFDSGAIWRNELRAPLAPLWQGPMAAVASPFLYFDAGYAANLGDGGARQFASGAGAGFDWRAGAHLTGGLTGGWALQHAAYTPAGAFKLLASARLTF
jgi:hemolysin activation/secretion protein